MNSRNRSCSHNQVHLHSHRCNNQYHNYNHHYSIDISMDDLPELALLQDQAQPVNYHFHHDFHSEHWSKLLHKHNKIDIYIYKSYDYILDSFKSQNHIACIVYSVNYSQKIALLVCHNHLYELLTNIYHKIPFYMSHRSLRYLQLSLLFLSIFIQDIVLNLDPSILSEIDEFFCNFFEYLLVNS